MHLGAHAEAIEVETEALAHRGRRETEIALEPVHDLPILAARMSVEILLQPVARGRRELEIGDAGRRSRASTSDPP